MGAHLVARYAGGRQAFERVPDVFRFAALAAVASTAVAATIGMTSLVPGRPRERAGPGIGLAHLVARRRRRHPRGGAAAASVVHGSVVGLEPRATRRGRAAPAGGGAGERRGLRRLVPLARAELSARVRCACCPCCGRPCASSRAAPLRRCWCCPASPSTGRSTASAPSRDSRRTSRCCCCRRSWARPRSPRSGSPPPPRNACSSEEQLLYLVEHDPLTGVLSRKRFEAELQHELAMSLRYGTRGAVLFLDLDDFKAVNDAHGPPRRRRAARAPLAPAEGPAARHRSRGAPGRRRVRDPAPALRRLPGAGGRRTARRGDRARRCRGPREGRGSRRASALPSIPTTASRPTSCSRTRTRRCTPRKRRGATAATRTRETWRPRKARARASKAAPGAEKLNGTEPRAGGSRGDAVPPEQERKRERSPTRIPLEESIAEGWRLYRRPCSASRALDAKNKNDPGAELPGRNGHRLPSASYDALFSLTGTPWAFRPPVGPVAFPLLPSCVPPRLRKPWSECRRRLVRARRSARVRDHAAPLVNLRLRWRARRFLWLKDGPARTHCQGKKSARMRIARQRTSQVSPARSSWPRSPLPFFAATAASWSAICFS